MNLALGIVAMNALAFGGTSTARLDAILADPALAGASISVFVSTPEGKVVYERDSALRLLPASNEKLFTCVYALAKLGPRFRPTTMIFKRADGSLEIACSGNPDLTFDDYRRAREQLKLPSGTAVHVWEAYHPGRLEGWELGDLANRYAPSISALTVDDGGFEVWWDGAAVQCVNGAWGLKPVVARDDGPPRVDYDPIARTLVVRGNLPMSRLRVDTLAIPEPTEAVPSMFGVYAGALKSQPAGQPVMTISGPTFAQSLQRCLSFSQNDLAENFLLMAALREGPLGADAERTALDRERRFLAGTVGIERDDVLPSDGSGVGRHSLVTARAVVKLLTWAMRQPDYPVWFGALPSFGYGTMSARGVGHDIRAKDGTLQRVSSYSGYLRTKSGQTLCFSLLFNGFVCPDAKARAIQDAFVAELDS